MPGERLTQWRLKEPPKLESTTPTDTPKPAQPVKEEPSRTVSLFDATASPAATEERRFWPKPPK